MTPTRNDNEVVDFLVALHGYPDRATAFRNHCEQMFDEAALIESWRSLRPHPDHPAAVQEIPIARPPDMLAALKALRIDANRLCDRMLGGTYEEDCRRSIALADEAIKAAAIPPSPSAPDTEPTEAQCDAAWKNVTDPRRQAPLRLLYEDAALDVVKAIRREYLPDMDSNDGGEILSWLLDLVSVAVITEVDRERGVLLSGGAASSSSAPAKETK